VSRARYAVTYGTYRGRTGWRVVPVGAVVAAADGFKPWAGPFAKWRAKRHAAKLNRGGQR
jgi:hypothetical protein